MEKHNKKERMHEIVSVFLNHGILRGFKSKNMPVSLRESFDELGSTFVKIGQMLSMRSDLLPQAYIAEFQKFQDNARPETFEAVKAVIEADLRRPVSDIFSCLDPVPIASASIAQVHAACLRDGRKVVVKVLRPRVRETMMNDLRILKRLSRYVRHTPQNKIMNFEEILGELEASAAKELDFLYEADNIREFSKNNKDVRFITCPSVYKEYTTHNVLVMDFIDGIKISETDKLVNEGYDIDEICRKLAFNYFKQIFEDGFFHADPHPGNVMINKNKIAYIDFGMMGTLSSQLKERFNLLLYGLIAGDADDMAQAVFKIAIKKGSIDMQSFRSEIESIYTKYIDTSLSELDLGQLIGDLLEICRNNQLSMPKEITMLLKGMLTIEGVLEKLSPGIRIMDMLMPYVKGRIFKTIDPKKEIAENLLSLYLLSKSGPEIIKETGRLLKSASSGKFKVQMEHTNLEGPADRLNHMVNRVVFSIIIAAVIIGSSMIVSTETGPQFYGISAIAVVGYVGALLMGLWLIILIIKSGM